MKVVIKIRVFVEEHMTIFFNYLFQGRRNFISERQWLKMAKFRMVRTDFWTNPIVCEEMTPEDKFFSLYLHTNPQTTQIGIYKITKKQMAFDLGYTIESVHSLMDRFIHHHKLIRYNPETRELAIQNWGKYNLDRGGKPFMDCILSELKEVEDLSLIQYVSKAIQKQEIRSLFESSWEQEELVFGKEVTGQVENDTYLEPESEELDDVMTRHYTVGGQKEEKQKQEAFNPYIEKNHDIENNQKVVDVKEIIEFWDNNGFGLSNLNAKEQLLAALDDSSFLQPKEVILKAMKIACANNKRRLSYVVGILKNWKNDSLLTVEEIETFYENQSSVPKQKQSTETFPTGRPIPGRFVLDITAGEEE